MHYLIDYLFNYLIVAQPKPGLKNCSTRQEDFSTGCWGASRPVPVLIKRGLSRADQREDCHSTL